MNLPQRLRQLLRPQRSALSLPTWVSVTSGLTYPNQDIAPTRAGFAAAYTAVIAVYRAVNIRADALNALPWCVKQLPADGDYEAAQVVATSKHPWGHAFARAVARHRVDTGRAFFKTLQAYMDLFGEIYVELADAPGGLALRVVNSQYVTPVVVDDQIVAYQYTGGSAPVTLAAEQVCYSAAFNPYDDLRGLSVVAVALDAVNVERNLKRFLRDFFINNARPGMILSPAGDDMFTQQQKAEIVRELQDFHRGSGSQYAAFVAPKAVSITALDQPNIEGNYAISQTIQREIYTAFGVPISMAGDDRATTYKQGREVYENFVANTILPLAVDVQEFVNAQIMPRFDLRALFEFDLSHLQYVSDAQITTHQMAREDFNAGLITLNEARARIGAPALDDRPADALPNPVRAAVDLTPTAAMAEEARRGLKWRREHGRGGTLIGVARARDIANRRRLSPDTVRRMAAYFARHDRDREAQGWRPGEQGYPSAGRIAWALWGGDPGREWAARKLEQLEAQPPAAPAPPPDVPLKAADNLLDTSARAMIARGERPGRWSRAAALKELDAWERFLVRRAEKANARAFVPQACAGRAADVVTAALAAGLPPAAAIAAGRRALLPRAFARELAQLLLVMAGVKSIEDVRDEFRAQLAPVLFSANLKEIDRRRAGTIVRFLIAKYVNIAYREGMREVGVEGEPSEEERQQIKQLIKEQSPFVSELTKLLRDETLSEAELVSRVEAWVNGALMPAYNAGLASAGENGMFEWREGDTVEKCKDCLRLDGQRHRWRDWAARNLLPGTPGQATECKGFNCQCKLIPVSGEARGDF
jgi:HK97 family phage portal protein